MPVMRIPRGFSLMNLKRTSVSNSACTFGRNMIRTRGYIFEEKWGGNDARD